MSRALLVCLAVLALAFAVFAAPRISDHSLDSFHSVVCDGCVGMITILESWVQKNTTEEEIFHFVDQVCPYLKENAAVCPYMVDQMGPIIIEAILSHVSPPVVCEMMHLCAGNNKPAY